MDAMYAKLQYFFSAFIFTALFVISLHQANADRNRLRPDSRIVGGTAGRNVDIPYIVSLMTFGMHSCGGAIINERTIITAAHCLAYTRPSIMRVHAGSKSKGFGGGGGAQVIPVLAIYSHERWTMADMDYDIGLVRLSRALRYSQSVQPIKLVSSADVLRDGIYGIIAGWGLTTPNGGTSNVLRYASVPVVNHELCNRLMNDRITDRMFCAGYLEGGIDACQMDSGGPLAIDGKLAGIVSWGIGCALPNKPGVYTRVSELLPWVQEIMKNEFNECLE